MRAHVIVVSLASATIDVHAWLAWVMVFTNGVAGVWALAAHRRHSWQGWPLWVLTVIAEVSVLAQACLGSWLIAQEGREAPGLHALYGFSAVVAVGIVFSYRQQLHQHICLLYGGAGLFLMGMGIRAMILG